MRYPAPGQVSERFQPVPDGRDLIGPRVRGDLAGDRADTPRHGRGPVRGLLFPVPGAADGRAAGRDHQPAAGPRTAPNPASTPAPAPAARRPNPANDPEPAVAAATPTACSPASQCRRPRLFREPGNGQADQQGTGRGQQPPGTTTARAGRRRLAADDGQCESSHRSARTPPATPRPARHIAAVMTPQVTA